MKNDINMNSNTELSGKSILTMAKSERERLIRIIDAAQKSIDLLPPGRIEIRKNRNSLQFYYKKDRGEQNSVYMPVANRKTAYGVIQRGYLERFKRTAEEQLRELDRLCTRYDPRALEKVFLSASPARQKLLRPVVLPDDLFAAKWQAVQYEKKEFAENAAVHYTEKNERVRSKSEVLIANALNRAGIPYHYEKPLTVGSNIFHPDFTVLRLSDRKEMYWEHLGMMDDKEYSSNALRKIRTYEEYGIFPGDRLIITSETYKLPFNLTIINRTIDHFLKL